MYKKLIAVVGVVGVVVGVNVFCFIGLLAGRKKKLHIKS
jgi:xanthosine utilization system XapX-like protein